MYSDDGYAIIVQTTRRETTRKTDFFGRSFFQVGWHLEKRRKGKGEEGKGKGGEEEREKKKKKEGRKSRISLFQNATRRATYFTV